MRRRHLLASTALFAATAGCFADDRSPTETDDPPTPPAVTELEGDAADPPLSLFARDLGVDGADDATAAIAVRIGDDGGSHWVVAMADTDDAIETTVSVARSDSSDEPLYEATVGLSRSTYAAVNLRERDRYAIAFEWDDHREVVTVAERYVDCNESTGAVLLDPDGEAAIVEETELTECN
ncbi:hypothetical protein [Halosolutus gelatinilyticus]|uniref:hypothetical protein n=1 Tax=Halosolutus gelatinilyticus TaxID=2931975 RepID=UPI001FF56D8F|nr:hypothetical protein [Halosolutus gelatinilyticus]